jgi:PRTRC genetic system protein B
MITQTKTSKLDYQSPAAAALADAALYFVEGQYLFHHRSDKDEEVKYLSPSVVRQAFLLESVDSGWLSAEAVRWGTGSRGEYVISFYRPARFELLVRASEDVAEMIMTVPLPGMIFAGCNQTWFVWSVKAHRFSPDLELFHAPLPNVAANGLICFGQNQHPSVNQDGAHAAWQLFINSAFNTHHVDGKSHEFPQDILLRLASLSARKARRYPLRDLVSLGCTVGDAARSLIER